MSRLALLILIIGVIHRGNADTKTCTYTWVTPITGTAAGTYTRSIGAPLSFSMTIDDVIEVGDTNIWKNDDGAIVTATSTTAGEFPAESATGVTSGFTVASGSGTAHTYTMTYTNGAPEAQNGKKISVRNLGCDADSTAVTLTVTSCDLTAFGDQASAVDQTACNYDCDKEFKCSSDSTVKFTAKCLADTTWSLQRFPCSSAGVREVAILALVMLCSSLSATHLM